MSAFSSIVSSSSRIQVPVAVVERRADVQLTLWLRATSIERVASTPAPDEAISSISSNDTTSSLRAFGTSARVGRVDAAHVGVDLAVLGAERCGERDRGRVGAAAPERRHVLVGRHALESGDEDDPVLVERLVDPPRAHVDDLRLAVRRVGDDARLRAGERDRLVAEVVDGHRAERVRDPLADRDEHVELARVGPSRDLRGEVEELVGRVPHRGEDADDAVPRLAHRDESARDVLDLLRVADRRTAELHHDGAALRRLRPRTAGTASYSIVVTGSRSVAANSGAGSARADKANDESPEGREAADEQHEEELALQRAGELVDCVLDTENGRTDGSGSGRLGS